MKPATLSLVLLFALPMVAASAIVAPALAGEPSEAKNPGRAYRAWLSPEQEGGEESETPPALQKSLGSTAPSTPRAQRTSRGYGELVFTNDLSRAKVDVKIEGVKPEDIVMFHIHCGPPGVLGPVAVDLGAFGPFTKTVVNGRMQVELKNEHIVTSDTKSEHEGHAPPSLKLPEGCPVEIGFPTQVNTIAGLEYLASKGALYFNLHTKAHTYFGEMRGKLFRME